MSGDEDERETGTSFAVAPDQDDDVQRVDIDGVDVILGKPDASLIEKHKSEIDAVVTDVISGERDKAVGSSIKLLFAALGIPIVGTALSATYVRAMQQPRAARRSPEQHNLPYEQNPEFVGRTDELAQLTAHRTTRPSGTTSAPSPSKRRRWDPNTRQPQSRARVLARLCVRANRPGGAKSWQPRSMSSRPHSAPSIPQRSRSVGI